MVWRAASFVYAISAAITHTVTPASTFNGVQRELVDHYITAKDDINRGDYQTAFARTDLMRPGSTKPITVEVQFMQDALAQSPEAYQAVRGAFAMWGGALHQQTFRLAERNESPDVVILFKTDVSQNGAALGGFVNWSRRICGNVGVTNGDIQVRTIQPNGISMTIPQLRHEIAHELGHVLGLTDDERVGHVMSGLNLNDPVDTISAEDVEGLMNLRQYAFMLRQVAQNESNSRGY